MKGQSTIWFSEILKLKSVSLLDLGNFKHYSFQLLHMSHYWNHTDAILILFWKLKFLLSINQKNFYKYLKPIQIFDHFRSEYKITLSHKIISLVMNHSNVCVKCSFSALKRVHMHTHGRLTKLSWRTAKKILQDLLHKTEVQVLIKEGKFSSQ